MKVRQTEIEIREVEHEILHPQRRALADRRELRGLKMRVAERRFVLPPDCERSESPQDGNQARAKQSQAALHLDQVRVVGDERARRAQVNHTARRGRGITEGMHMRHHVVTEPLLELGDLREIDVVHVLTHRGDGSCGDIDPEVVLRLCERDPKPPPESVTGLG